ncbi:MAG: MATE family efflux transporter [Sphingomonadaceae bacterium]
MTDRPASGATEAKLHRAIWAIALPSMLTNVATALFGLADLWVIGQLGDAPAQAGVELGAKFMIGLLVVFNFLKTGTIALTAQAAGRGEASTQGATLARGIGAALALSLLLLAAMPLAIPLGLEFLNARGEFEQHARAYVAIRYWGAPLWLLNAVLVGWLVGRRRVREVLAVEVAANLFHIALDILFVLVFFWGVEGVAAATLISEALKLAALLFIATRQNPFGLALSCAAEAATWSRPALAALLRINRDLFLRTLLLTGAILLLTRDGAHEGPVVLAANGILYQMFILSAMILDGFEAAAQVLCGEATGARRRRRFDRLVKVLLAWGLGFGALVSGLYALLGAPFAASFSTDAEVVETTLYYLPWAIALPLAGVTSFVFDGIYVGATWTRALLATMMVAFALYALALILTGPMGNHGLWLSFTIFLVARAAAQAALLPVMRRRSFA